MASVWSTDLPIAEKMVLLSLADNANDEGVCWPSIGTICKKTSLTERTVQKCISKLKDKELLTVKGRHGHSNVFSIHLMTFFPERQMNDMGGQTLIHNPVLRTPPPPQSGRGTPANGTPRIIKEPSFEPPTSERLIKKPFKKEIEYPETPAQRRASSHSLARLREGLAKRGFTDEHED